MEGKKVGMEDGWPCPDMEDKALLKHRMGRDCTGGHQQGSGKIGRASCRERV